MRAPEFWWRRRSLAALLLAPAGLAAGALAARRMREAGARPPVPVVCVGNFVAGGAGKTPTALAVGRIVAEAGFRPAFLTRGYGGRLAGPVRVDPERHAAADVGDEALLLARLAPTVVARRRPDAFPLLLEAGATMVVMDDGFQNPSVEKTLSLVVVDGVVGVGNARVMPAGPLRAPLGEQFPRADAVVVLGEGDGARDIVRRAARAGKPVLRARLVPRGLGGLRSWRVYGFCGIGRPEKFRRTLEEGGAEVVGWRAFADHHPYTGLEAGEILAAADAAGAEAIVTTEKDAVRLAGAGPGAKSALLARARVVGVDCVFEDESRLLHLVREARAGWLSRR